MRLFLGLLWSWFGWTVVAGQSFGGNPSSLKWKQLNTPSTRVIFPKGQDSAARRVASLTQALQHQEAGRLSDKVKKISVVIQPDVTYSNAYVMLGPWRSEYFMTPPQDPFYLGSINWADNLAVHEWKHVEQYSHFNRGLSKFMGIISGQQGRALANAMSIPDWFFEGDAVWNETVYTQQGRGRLPFSFNGFKSLQQKGRQYKWMQWRNGSLRALVPDHYDLGYLLVSYGRQKYGDSIWQSVTRDAAAFKGLFYPMQKAVKRQMGISYSQFTNEALSYFNTRFAAQKTAEPQWLTPVQKHNVVNYKYPYPGGQGETYVLRNSYRDIPAFYSIDSAGKERKIAVRDIGYDDYFSYNNGRIVYTALEPDTRWGNRDFTAVRLLDVYNGNVNTIVAKTKLFSPDVSADARQIVAVEVIPGKPASLSWLSTENGEVQYSMTLPEAPMLSHPKFTGTGQQVLVAGRQDDGKMGWLLCDPVSGQWNWLLPPATRVVGFPVVQGQEVVFTMSLGGVDGIYGLSLKGGEPKPLAAYPTGIYQAFRRGGQVTGAVYTADGYRLASLGESSLESAKAPDGTGSFRDFYVPGTIGARPVPADKAAAATPVSKYKKSLGFLNFHSWLPEISESEYTMNLIGNNVLNTTETSLYYTYNNNERSHAAGAQFLYGGWYVQPFAGGKQTWGREIVYNADTTFIYNESELSAGLRLPLNFSFGKQYRYLTLSSSVHTERVRWQGIGKGLLRDQDFDYLRFQAQYTSQIQKARQHIYPRFAQSLLLDYRTIINKLEARQFLASGSFYLPGFWRNHNIVLSAAYQARDTMRQYIFSNSFPFSRGYNAVNYPRMVRLGVNYHLPLLYPEWGFGQMLYFLRIRGNLFYDYTSGKSLRTGLVTPFSTVGTEVYFDTRWWNQLPLSIGVRYSHLLDPGFGQAAQSNVWEIILPVNLY